MAFRNKNKIKALTFPLNSPEYARLLWIAAWMIDRKYHSGDIAYRGVPSKKNGCFSSFLSRKNTFTHEAWTTWLWCGGYVESRDDIPLLQLNLIRAGFIQIVSGKDAAPEQQVYCVSQKITSASTEEGGIPRFQDVTPVFQLNDGKDGILYSIRNRGILNRQVRLSSKSLIHQGVEHGYTISNTSTAVPTPQKNTKKNTTTRDVADDNDAKIRYVMHSETNKIRNQYRK